MRGGRTTGCTWDAAADAKLTRLWSEMTMTADQIGKVFKTTGAAIKTRAATIGLPRRNGAHLGHLRMLGQPRKEATEARNEAERAIHHGRVCLAHGGFPAAVVVEGRTVHVYPDRRAA